MDISESCLNFSNCSDENSLSKGSIGILLSASGSNPNCSATRLIGEVATLTKRLIKVLKINFLYENSGEFTFPFTGKSRTILSFLSLST